MAPGGGSDFPFDRWVPLAFFHDVALVLRHQRALLHPDKSAAKAPARGPVRFTPNLHF